MWTETGKQNKGFAVRDITDMKLLLACLGWIYDSLMGLHCVDLGEQLVMASFGGPMKIAIDVDAGLQNLEFPTQLLERCLFGGHEI